LFFCPDIPIKIGAGSRTKKIKAELISTPKKGRLKQKFRQKQANFPELLK